MIEIWKTIKEYPDYKISSLGRVQGPKGIRKLSTKKDGRLAITIKGKEFRVHRLVAQEFVPNPNNYPEVHHIDGDYTNNVYSNLQWCDRNLHKDMHKEMGYIGWGKKEYHKKQTEEERKAKKKIANHKRYLRKKEEILQQSKDYYYNNLEQARKVRRERYEPNKRGRYKLKSVDIKKII